MRKKTKESLEKQIKTHEQILVDWNKLMDKKSKDASEIKIGINNPKLWPFLHPKGFLKSERQLFLKLCVPNSGVLSKNESEQIQALEANNGTHLKLLAEIEVTVTRLIILKKEYNDEFSSHTSHSAEQLKHHKDNEENDDINF